MKSRVIAAVLSVGMLCLASQASAFELFGMLGGGYGGCGCEVACGHEPACGCAPKRCKQRCPKQRCCRERCHHLKNRFCGGCGCDAVVPTCAAPVAPSCGIEPACGCDHHRARCCKQRCPKQRCPKQRCCRERCHHLKNRFAGCGCEPACGIEPACGFMGK
jgi:hypothetical protein